MGRVSDAREKLMSAILELIWSGSYGNTTIDQICERAGVKKGSFYYFFDSKADLAVAAILTGLGMMMLSPPVISLPCKLLLFVTVDGWTLVCTGVVQSFR